VAFVVLEVVRDKNGRVTNVVAVNAGQVRKVAGTTSYVQIVDDVVVAHFEENEIVIAEVREGDSPA